MRGIRPYRMGDPVRDIHWAATARTGEAQVRLHDYTARSQLLVVFNAERIDQQWSDRLMDYEEADIEHVIALAATVCMHALALGLCAGFATNMPLGKAEESTLLPPVTSAEREEALAKQLAEMRTRKRKLVDPLQFEMSIQAEDLSGYIPSFGWEAAPPSVKQLAALEKYGIFPDEVTNAGKAAKLLDRLALRRSEGLATPKQIRFLEGRGFLHVGTWKMEDARRLIDRIAANNWHTPYDITPKNYHPEVLVSG